VYRLPIEKQQKSVAGFQHAFTTYIDLYRFTISYSSSILSNSAALADILSKSASAGDGRTDADRAVEQKFDNPLKPTLKDYT
jgi:hypothetical protein